MQIVIDIPDGKETEYTQAFIKVMPKPGDFVGNNRQWMKAAVRNWYVQIIHAGKKIVASEAVVFDGADIG